MAQRTVVLLQDDLDGGTAVETVTFSLDGVEYEIDLSAENGAALRGVFGPFLDAARRVGGRAPVRAAVAAPVPVRPAVAAKPRNTNTKVDKAQLTAIRAWARGRGLEVNDRGRIPRHIIEQYNADPLPTVALTPAVEASPEPAPEAAPPKKKGAPSLQFSEPPR